MPENDEGKMKPLSDGTKEISWLLDMKGPFLELPEEKDQSCTLRAIKEGPGK